MSKRLKHIILFSTAVLALGTIGSTTASVNANAMFIPANQYVVRHQSKILGEMSKHTSDIFDEILHDNPIGPYDKNRIGFLLLHPKYQAGYFNLTNAIHFYANGNPLKNGYRNYLSGTYKIYAKPGSQRHNRVVANKRTVNKLAKNYVPCRVLRQTVSGYHYQQVQFKSGLTGWIDEDGTYQSNSYSKVKSYISAYNAFFLSPRKERKSLMFYARFNNKEGHKARIILKRYRARKVLGNKVSRRIMGLINTSAYNVYRNHRHMNKTAKRDLAKATKLINHYKHIHHVVLKYDLPIIYKSLIKTAKKGRVATRYNDDSDSNYTSSYVTSSKKATLYNIRHVRLVRSYDPDY